MNFFYFSSSILDSCNGFHQIPIHPETRDIIALAPMKVATDGVVYHSD